MEETHEQYMSDIKDITISREQYHKYKRSMEEESNQWAFILKMGLDEEYRKYLEDKDGRV